MSKLKPPVPDIAYYPIRGWNPDANGLALHQEECADILNMRILGHEINRREGSQRLGRNIPGNDPILHIHNHKTPEGEEKVFAFTKDTVYEFTPTDTLWKYASKFLNFDTCEVATNWVSDNYTPAISTEKYQGTNSIAVNVTSDIADDEVLLGKAGSGAMDWDASDYTHITLFYMNEHTEAIDVTVKFYSDDARTTLIEELSGTLSVTAGDFKELALEMGTPANFSSIQSWEILSNGGETVATAFDLHVDYVCGLVKLPNDVEFWSTARYTDDTEGETVIAAGSNPPLFSEAESDGSSRTLLYLDTTNDYFDTLQLKRNVSLGDEDTGVNGPATASTVTSSSALVASGLSGFVEIVEGSFSIYTSELGTLASSSSIDESGKFKLVPADDTKIQAGANSWVKKDGTSWSLEFLDDTYDGMSLFVAYTYKITVDYKPRYVKAFHSRVLFGSTYEDSTYFTYRVRWSNVGEFDLINESDYADLIEHDNSPIVAWELLGFYLTVYKTDSVIKCSYIGGAGTFVFNTVWKEGIFAGRTVQNYDNKHYILGKSDVQMWNGSRMWSISQNVGQTETQHRVRESIFETLNADKINNCFGVFYPRWKEYWLFVVGSGETYPTRAYVYSILKDIWYFFEFSEAFTCAGTLHIQSSPTIDELVGTIDEQNWRLEGGYNEGTRVSLVMGQESGEVNYIDGTIGTDGGYIDASGTWNSGTEISTRIITRDFIFDDLPREDRVTQLDFEAQGTEVEVSYSNQYTVNIGSYRVPQDIVMGADFSELSYFPDAVGAHIRFKFEASTSWAFRWMQPYAVVQEFQNE